MDLFGAKRQQAAQSDLPGRLAALERYADYLRQQGEYGLEQLERRLTALESASAGKAD